MISYVKRLNKEQLNIVKNNMEHDEFLEVVWLDHTKGEKEEWCICIMSMSDDYMMELLESDFDTEEEAKERVKEIENIWNEERVKKNWKDLE